VSRNVSIWLSFASALGLYLLGGIISYIGTRIVGGLLRSSHLDMALGVLAFAAIFLASIIYFAIWFARDNLDK
jgi:hypothetical protein